MGEMRDQAHELAHDLAHRAEGRLGLTLTHAQERSLFAMLAVVILVGMGEHTGRQFLPLYLMMLGGGELALGLLGGLDNLLGALYSFPGGVLSDRFGQKRMLRVFNLMAMAGYALVIFVPAWWSVVLGACLFLAWSAVSMPACMSLVSNILPHKQRVMGVTLHSLIRRVPMIVGPLMGGWLISHYQGAGLGQKEGLAAGTRAAFVLALALAVVGQLLMEKYMQNIGKPQPVDLAPWRVWKHMNRDLKVLLVSDILVRFAEQIPYAFVVVWCVTLNQVSALQFGWLKALEMAVALAIYIPVAWAVQRGGKKPFVVATFFFFAAFPLMLSFAHGFWAMVPAFVVRGLKEFGEPSRKALIIDLAPAGHEGSVFGLYYLIRDVLVSLAAFGAAWLWRASPLLNFYTAAAFGVAGALFFWAFGRDARPRPHKA